MTTLKDYMRDLQNDTIQLVLKYVEKEEHAPNEVEDREKELEDLLDITIDRIVARLIGQEQ